jgi:hypothetical protein
MFAKNRQIGSRREISRFHPVSDRTREKAERGEGRIMSTRPSS